MNARTVGLCFLLAAANSTRGQTLESCDDYAAQVMKDFKVPGLGIAVVKDGKVILAKGYGFGDAENKLPDGVSVFNKK